MSISLLKKMKKELIKATTPSHQEQVCKALRTIFHSTEEMAEHEAFKVLDWEYTSIEELHNNNIDADKVSICDNGDNKPIVINGNGNNKLPGAEGVHILNIVSVSKSLENNQI